MTDLEVTIRAAFGALGAEGLRAALIGGFAVSARTEPRFTSDVDLAVAVSGDAEAERLVRRLAGDGHTVLATVQQDAVDRLATVRLQLRQGEQLDLLFASSGIEGEIVHGADRIEILPEVVLPVATVGHLIALKLLARAPTRPNDQADLVALRSTATPGDLDQAAEAVTLIEQRGYARGRDLRGALRTLVADSAD